MNMSNNNLWNTIPSSLNTHKDGSRSVWRRLGNLLTAVAILYILYILCTNFKTIINYEWDYLALSKAIVISLFIYLISLICQFWAWIRLIPPNHRIRRQDIEIYSKSIFMRSLPGGAWHWIGRTIMYAADEVIPRRVIIRSNIVEWGVQLLIGASLICLFLPQFNLAIRLVIFSGFLVFAITLSIRSLARTLRWNQKLGDGILLVTLYTIAWLLSILIFIVLLKGIHGTYLDFIPSIRAWTISGEISLLIIFMPTGLGIREISLSWLLQPLIPLSIGTLISLIIRIVYMTGDLLWGYIGWKLSLDQRN